VGFEERAESVNRRAEQRFMPLGAIAPEAPHAVDQGLLYDVAAGEHTQERRAPARRIAPQDDVAVVFEHERAFSQEHDDAPARSEAEELRHRAQ
jgi:hypothetical protein